MTEGLSRTADDAIKHVVLLMMENHSFDQMLGGLQSENPGVDGVDMEADVPRFNLDLAGNPVYQIPQDEQQVPRDPKHEMRFVLEQLANGSKGFVTSYQRNVQGTTKEDRQYIMGYYAPAGSRRCTN
jgi:phospholipase C